MDSLNKLKILLGITGDEDDPKLSLLLEVLTEQAMIYLGRYPKQPPAGLETVILQMAMDFLGQNNLGIESVKQNSLKSVKRGDTELTYNLTDTTAVGAFIRHYDALLRPFMLVKMR